MIKIFLIVFLILGSEFSKAQVNAYYHSNRIFSQDKSTGLYINDKLVRSPLQNLFNFQKDLSLSELVKSNSAAYDTALKYEMYDRYKLLSLVLTLLTFITPKPTDDMALKLYYTTGSIGAYGTIFFTSEANYYYHRTINLYNGISSVNFDNYKANNNSICFLNFFQVSF